MKQKGEQLVLYFHMTVPVPLTMSMSVRLDVRIHIGGRHSILWAINFA